MHALITICGRWLLLAALCDVNDEVNFLVSSTLMSSGRNVVTRPSFSWRDFLTVAVREHLKCSRAQPDWWLPSQFAALLLWDYENTSPQHWSNKTKSKRQEVLKPIWSRSSPRWVVVSHIFQPPAHPRQSFSFIIFHVLSRLDDLEQSDWQLITT